MLAKLDFQMRIRLLLDMTSTYFSGSSSGCIVGIGGTGLALSSPRLSLIFISSCTCWVICSIMFIFLSLSDKTRLLKAYLAS